MSTRREPRARLGVKVVARAARNEIVGWTGDRLRVRVAAVPEGGKANAVLEAFLSEAAGVPRSAVRVATGHGSTLKLVEFVGVEQSDLDKRFDRPRGV